jgi:hypothetical protein
MDEMQLDSYDAIVGTLTSSIGANNSYPPSNEMCRWLSTSPENTSPYYRQQLFVKLDNKTNYRQLELK